MTDKKPVKPKRKYTKRKPKVATKDKPKAVPAGSPIAVNKLLPALDDLSLEKKALWKSLEKGTLVHIESVEHKDTLDYIGMCRSSIKDDFKTTMQILNVKKHDPDEQAYYYEKVKQYTLKEHLETVNA